MAEWGFRKGRREAAENLSASEEGDCPRCGGEKQPSSLAGYLSCSKCGYEWKDPDHVAKRKGPPETYRRDAELSGEGPALFKVKDDIKERNDLSKLFPAIVTKMKGVASQRLESIQKRFIPLGKVKQ